MPHDEQNLEIALWPSQDITEPAMLAHLLKYDSALGAYPQAMKLDGDSMVVGERRIRVFGEKEGPEGFHGVISRFMWFSTALGSSLMRLRRGRTSTKAEPEQ